MLVLGDIVIPGIFIVLLLKVKRKSYLYFYATFIAYFLSLMSTIFVMHVHKHAQPALLYLVLDCISTPLLLALVKGDIKTLFAYEDHPELEQEEKKKNKELKAAAKPEKKKNK